MARLFIAVTFLAVLTGLLAVLGLGLRAALEDRRAATVPAEEGTGSVQKLAFALLMALILYVSVYGGA